VSFSNEVVITTAAPIAKILADCNNLIDDPDITHCVLYSPAPAADFQQEIIDYEATGKIIGNLEFAQDIEYGSTQDGRATDLLEQPGEESKGKLTFLPFLGPIFDIVSSLPLVGEVLKPITSVIKGAIPSLGIPKHKLTASDFFVFDVSKDGNDVQFKYDSTVNAMTLDQYRIHLAQRGKKNGAIVRKLFRDQKVSNSLAYQASLPAKKAFIEGAMRRHFAATAL